MGLWTISRRRIVSDVWSHLTPAARILIRIGFAQSATSFGCRSLTDAFPDALEREPVGTNKRYADSVDRDQLARVHAMVRRDTQPCLLESVELELARLPLTCTPVPELISVWLHCGNAAIRVEAEMVAWTPRALQSSGRPRPVKSIERG